MKTVLAMDAGDICLQKEINIPLEMNYVELSSEISSLAPKLLDDTLRGLFNGSLTCVAQNEDDATFTKKIKNEDKIIDWSSNALVLHNKIRAMYGIATNYTTFNDKKIQILKTKPLDKNSCPAQISEITKNSFIVGCLEGSIEVFEVKPEGKREMKALDWVNGARIKVGDMFK